MGRQQPVASFDHYKHVANLTKQLDDALAHCLKMFVREASWTPLALSLPLQPYIPPPVLFHAPKKLAGNCTTSTGKNEDALFREMTPTIVACEMLLSRDEDVALLSFMQHYNTFLQSFFIAFALATGSERSEAGAKDMKKGGLENATSAKRNFSLTDAEPQELLRFLAAVLQRGATLSSRLEVNSKAHD